MARRRDATSGALTLVNTLWALAVGTYMLWWIRTDLYPHLVADGSLEGDLTTLLFAFALGVVLAAPSVFKSRSVDLIEAAKEWRKTRDVE